MAIINEPVSRDRGFAINRHHGLWGEYRRGREEKQEGTKAERSTNEQFGVYPCESDSKSAKCFSFK